LQKVGCQILAQPQIVLNPNNVNLDAKF